MSSLEAQALPLNGRGWTTPRGRLGIWTPDPTILVVVLSGYGHAQFATHILDACSKLSVTRPRSLYFDAQTLERYDSELRLHITHRVKADLPRINELAALVRSSLVAMGATVASLALGGKLKSYTNRDTFVVSLEQALRRSGVQGFPCKVLSSAHQQSETAAV